MPNELQGSITACQAVAEGVPADAEMWCEHSETLRAAAEPLYERAKTLRANPEMLCEHAETLRADPEMQYDHAAAPRAAPETPYDHAERCAWLPKTLNEHAETPAHMLKCARPVLKRVSTILCVQERAACDAGHLPPPLKLQRGRLQPTRALAFSLRCGNGSLATEYGPVAVVLFGSLIASRSDIRYCELPN